MILHKITKQLDLKWYPENASAHDKMLGKVSIAYLRNIWI